MPLKFLHLLRAFSQNYYIVNFTYLINVYKEDVKAMDKSFFIAVIKFNARIAPLKVNSSSLLVQLDFTMCIEIPLSKYVNIVM